MTDPFDLVHPLYTKRLPEWRYTEGAYAADYLTVPSVAGGTAKTAGTVASVDIARAAQYIPRVPLGEAIERYRHMLATIDPDGLFPYALGSLAGQIAAVEPDAARAWAPEGGDGPLGDPEQEGSPAHRLLRDADGQGTDWGALWIASATDLLLYQRLWFAVKGLDKVEVPTIGDGTETVERASCVYKLTPMEVPYWKEVNGLLVEAHVARTRQEGDTEIQVRHVYKLGGWEKWEKGDGDAAMVDSGTYAYFSDADGNTPCLPIFPVDLNLRYYVAYVLARKAMAALGMEARGDVATLTSTVARLIHKSDAPETASNAGTGGTVHRFVQQVVDGSSLHVIGTNEDVAYVAPDMSAAREARDRGKGKRERFLMEAYQAFGDQARQLTATQVRAEQRSGTGAILALVSDRMDEAENRTLRLLSQAEAPDRSDAWGAASVTRSKEFVAVDEAERATALAGDVFGSAPVPVGPRGRREAAARFASAYGLSIDPDEVAAEVAQMDLTRAIRPDRVPSGTEPPNEFAPAEAGPPTL